MRRRREELQITSYKLQIINVSSKDICRGRRLRRPEIKSMRQIYSDAALMVRYTGRRGRRPLRRETKVRTGRLPRRFAPRNDRGGTRVRWQL